MPKDEANSDSARSHVRALARGLDTLKALGTVPEGASLSDIAAIVDLDRATTRRFLLTLCDLGYARLHKKRFYLAPKVLELGFSYFSTMSRWDAIQPLLNEYTERTMGTISIGVRDGMEVIYMARAQSKRSVYAINVTVGSRFPLYSTSMGRILISELPENEVRAILADLSLDARTPLTVTDPDRILANLADVRKNGYSISDQETEMGIRSIAIPLRDRSGAIIAALNTSVTANHTSADDLVTQFLPSLRETAGQLEPLMWIPR